MRIGTVDPTFCAKFRSVYVSLAKRGGISGYEKSCHSISVIDISCNGSGTVAKAAEPLSIEGRHKSGNI